MLFSKCGEWEPTDLRATPVSPKRPRRNYEALLATQRDEGRLSSGLRSSGLFKTRFFEHRVPRQDCGETWQMVTCARPQCGGLCRPEARTSLCTFLSSPYFYKQTLKRPH